MFSSPFLPCFKIQIRHPFQYLMIKVVSKEASALSQGELMKIKSHQFFFITLESHGAAAKCSKTWSSQMIMLQYARIVYRSINDAIDDYTIYQIFTHRYCIHSCIFAAWYYFAPSFQKQSSFHLWIRPSLTRETTWTLKPCQVDLWLDREGSCWTCQRTVIFREKTKPYKTYWCATSPWQSCWTK